MFGALRIDNPRLNVEQRAAYRACFCGACHALHEVGGRSTSLLTNYDQTVLALVLAGLERGATTRARCTGMPLRKVGVRAFSPAARELLAAANVLAVDAKLRDDLDDEGGMRLRARLGRRWLRRAAHTSHRTLRAQRFDTNLFEELPARQARAESTPHPTLETLAAPSAGLCAAMFGAAGEVTQRPELTPHLRAFGGALGRFVYAWDAWIDREDDAAHGRFNAIAACYGETGDDAAVRRFFDRQLDDARRALDALPLGSHGEILDALVASLERKVSAELPAAFPLRNARPAEAGDCDCGACDACDCCGDGTDGCAIGCFNPCSCDADCCDCCIWWDRPSRRRKKGE